MVPFYLRYKIDTVFREEASRIFYCKKLNEENEKMEEAEVVTEVFEIYSTCTIKIKKTRITKM